VAGTRRKLPRPGQNVSIRVLAGAHEGTYASLVEGYQPQGILVGAPFKGGVPLPLDKGTAVRVYYHDERTMYSFRTRVVDRAWHPRPTLLLAEPEEIERIQRRRFVRLQINLPVRYCLLNEQRGHDAEPEVREAACEDISAGGLLLVCPQGLTKGAELDLEVELEPDVPLWLVGRVVRVVEHPGPERPGRYGVEFIGVTAADRDLITRFIFRKQRELRRLGLL